MYISVSQAAEKWGLTTRRVRLLCAEGKISGAIQQGKLWKIPEDVVKPKDGRKKPTSMKIAVAGTGYVGLSLAVLLSQHNEVTAVDIVPEKVEKINNRISPIQDNEIEDYLANHKLNLIATTDADSAYKDVEFVIIAAPTNYDSEKNFLTPLRLKL